MIRRNFLKTVGAIVPGLLLPIETAVATYRHSIYGNYLGHSIRRNEIWEEGFFGRFIVFPIEVRLEVRFENGTFEFINWNSSGDLQNRIEKMSPQELLRDFDWSKAEDRQELRFPDEVNIAGEYYPARRERIRGKTSKFFTFTITSKE